MPFTINDNFCIRGALPAPQNALALGLLYKMLWMQQQTTDDVIYTQGVKIPDFPDTATLDLEQPLEPKMLLSASKYKVLDLRRSPLYPMKSALFPSDPMWRGLERYMLPSGTVSLVILEEYDEIFQDLNNKDDHYISHNYHDPRERDHIVIRGHAGIGKSCFLSYVLVSRLLQGKQTVLQLHGSNERYLILFNDSGVSYVPRDRILENPFVRDEKIWALFDDAPFPELFQPLPPDWLFIQAASQDQNQIDWRKYLPITKVFYLDIWSWEEILAAASADKTRDMEADKSRWILWCIFARYGGVPRLLFQDLKYGHCPIDTFLKEIAMYDKYTIGGAIDRYRRDLDNLLGGGDSFDDILHVMRPKVTSSWEIPAFRRGKRSRHNFHQRGLRTEYFLEKWGKLDPPTGHSWFDARYRPIQNLPWAIITRHRLYRDRVMSGFVEARLNIQKDYTSVKVLASGSSTSLNPIGSSSKLFEDIEELKTLLMEESKDRLVSAGISGVYLRPKRVDYNRAFDAIACYNTGDSPCERNTGGSYTDGACSSNPPDPDSIPYARNTSTVCFFKISADPYNFISIWDLADFWSKLPFTNKLCKKYYVFVCPSGQCYYLKEERFTQNLPSFSPGYAFAQSLKQVAVSVDIDQL